MVLRSLPEAEQYCDECGTKMIPMAPKLVREVLKFVPAQLTLHRIYVRTYVCPECKENSEKNSIKSAKAPNALIPHSYASEPVTAHAMYQKYVNAVPLYRQEKDWEQIPAGKKDDLSEPAVQGVQYCDKLFAIERYCRENKFSFEKRHEFRNMKALEILKAFWAWLDKQHPTNGSRMEKAVTYARNQKPYAETYLQDGRCSLSNNPSENSIRPFTIGRKNWLFCDTPGGAHASATVYTMVEMAKAHGLNVENI